MSFTDQQRRVMTEQEFSSHWGGHRGKLFCTLCNHTFQVGDGWRWVYANGATPSFGNFSVCDKCDGPNVLARYQAACSLLMESMKDRGEGHWPVDLAARLIEAEALNEAYGEDEGYIPKRIEQRKQQSTKQRPHNEPTKENNDHARMHSHA